MSNCSPEHIRELEHHAVNIRRNVIKMLAHAGSGHTAGSLDLVDILTCLYFDVMNYSKDNPNDPGRDLLVLSNGHTCPALYATMAEAGLIPAEELITLRQFGSRLQGHPERNSLPWLETTSGPLGEGMSQAIGMAYALKYLSPANNRHVYCIVGDGELDEGQCSEAGLVASKYKLSNLTVIVDCNEIQLSGRTEDIMPQHHRLGIGWGDWNVVHALNGDAHRIAPLLDAFDKCHNPARVNCSPDAPTIMIAYTIPGKGISFIENDYHWHGKVPNSEQAQQALKELDEAEQCIN